MSGFHIPRYISDFGYTEKESMEQLNNEINADKYDYLKKRVESLENQILELESRYNLLKQTSISDSKVFNISLGALFKVSLKDNSFITIKPQIDKLIGCSAEELESKGFNWFIDSIESADLKSTKAKLNKLRNTQITDVQTSPIKFRWKQNQENLLWLQLLPAPSDSLTTEEIVCTVAEESLATAMQSIIAECVTNDLMIPILVLGTDKIHYANTGTAKILNMTTNDLYSLSKQGLIDLIHPADRTVFTTNIEKTFNSENSEIFEFEFRINSNKNDTTWLLAKSTKANCSSSATVKIALFDITKRKIAQQQLALNGARFRSIIEDNTEFINRFTPDGKLTFVNKACANMFGIDTGIAVGVNFYDFIPKEQHEIIKANIAKLTPENPSQETENTAISNGKIIFNKWINRGIFDKNGNLLEIQAVGRDITQEKIAFENLKESEDQLRTILDAMKNTIVLISDPDDNVLFIKFTPGLRKTYGLDDHNHASTIIRQIVTDPASKIYQSLTYVKNTKELFKFEDKFLLPNGRFNFEITFLPLVDKTGKLAKIVTICNDITEKKKLESQSIFRFRFETLLTNISTYFLNLPSNQIDEGLETALKALSEFLMADRSFIFEICKDSQTIMDSYEWSSDNPKSQPSQHKNLKYSDCRYILEPLLMLKHISIPDIDEMEDKSKIAKIIDVKKTKSLVLIPMINETRLMGFMGFESHTKKLHLEDEIIALLKVASEILVNLITRKRVETQLSQSEQRIKSIFESTDDFIVVWSKDDKIIYANRAFLEFADTHKKEILGKDPITLFPERSKLYHDWQSKVHQVIETGQTMHDRKNSSINHKDFIADSTLSPLRDSMGNIYGVAILTRNITEYEKIKNELDTYRDKMLQTEQLASIGTMSATLTHELNQPLTVLKLLIQQSLRKVKNLDDCPDLVLQNLAESIRELNNANNIVGRYRNFARKLPRETVEQVEIKLIMDKIVAALSKHAIKAGLEITVEDLDHLPKIETNLGELEQIFFIIIQNAIQAVDPTRNNTLKIYADKNNETISIFFEDTCQGILPENTEKIFEPFFTTKPPEVGTGLGLAIIKQILTSRGGRIKVKSEPKKGTCFELEIPVK